MKAYRTRETNGISVGWRQVMQFEHQNDKGENYALLYPKFEENEELKKAADEVGARNALQFDRKERGYRLYEAKLPDSKEFDVDTVFGRYA